PDEFLKENLEYATAKRQRKKGGPYSKTDKDKRRNEVYRLHFDYGYSARKIAELMKINRNTINRDIDYLHHKISKNLEFSDIEKKIFTTLQRMEIQQSRLREQLDKTTSNSERITIERLILDINYKILQINQKLIESNIRINAQVRDRMNDFLKNEKIKGGFVSYFDTIIVSKNAQEKIQRIISEEKQRHR
ncbi:MAG: hypothetical protein ACREAK_01570, partial [Nitrosarchaeum sp.]